MQLFREFAELMAWADRYRQLEASNADSPKDAKVAYNFGAQGIGLCHRTYVFEGDRLPHSVK